MDKLIQSLSPIERKILPYLEEKKLQDICKKSNLDKTSVLRALEYLNKKKLVELNYEKNICKYPNKYQNIYNNQNIVSEKKRNIRIRKKYI